MQSNLTIRALQPVLAGLEALGHDTTPLLAAAGLPEAARSREPEASVPASGMMRLWMEAELASGDHAIGLHVASAAPLESFEVHAYALLSSPTLRAALHRGCRYQSLIHPTSELVLDEGPSEAVLRHALPGGLPVPRQPAEFLAAAWLRLGRLVVGRDWQPRRVCFAHDCPRDTAVHRDLFGEGVLFAAGRTALHVANDLLDSENARADEALVQMMDRYAATALRWVPQESTLASQVRHVLVESLSSGPPSATQVATTLNMSVRSLHRGLRQEGTGFRKLLEQLRRERSVELLSDRHCSIAETAFLVGFSELSAFYRAFKRWTGSTPAEFRAEAEATR